MSITATRKVSSTTASSKRPERYVAGVEGHPFVEMIDTTNNVSIKDEARDENESRKQAFETPEKSDNKNDISSNSNYIPSAIEALSASGVYENAESVPAQNSGKIGVYGNNQSIIKEDKKEREGHSYLKHFYEKNELVEEVDELVWVT